MIEQVERKCQKIINLDKKTYQRIKFVIYALIVIITQVFAAAIFQKIYKVPYPRSNSQPDIDGKIPSDLFSNPFGVPLLYTLVGIILGYLTTPNNQRLTSVPRLQIFKFSFLSFIGLISLIISIIQTSLITTYIINSCQLVIIVLMAVFISSSSPRFRVHKRQIGIAFLLCMGILMYNLFDKKEQKGPNKSLTWYSAIFMLIMLLAGGYRPQVLSQIRDKYSPSPSYVYYSSCCYTIIMIIIASAITSNLHTFLIFIWQHDRLFLDIFLHSFLYGISQLFIYRGGIYYKQHIMPTIGVVSKLCTLILNSILFHHNLNFEQYLAIVIVFGAISIDIYLNYRQDKHEQSSQTKQLQNQIKEEKILEQQL